jgi:microcystin-dependent protein
MTITSLTTAPRLQTVANATAVAASAVIAVTPYAPRGPIISGTSISTVTVGLGSQSFVMQQFGLGFVAGVRVRATVQNQSTPWMEGVVTGYDGTNLIVNVTLLSGSGTYSAWNINVAGEQGSAGQMGPQGPQGQAGIPGGPPGPQGPSGKDGVNGLQGPVGPIGSQGLPGPVGPAYPATSQTPNAVGLGSKTFTTQAGLAYMAGTRTRAASAATPTDWMEGIVTSYSGTSLVLNVDTIGTVGSHSDWTFSIAGTPGGPAGPQGLPGPSGAAGGQGPPGPQGPQGVPGVKGDTGSQGVSGNQGVPGPAGPQGEVGPPGPMGTPFRTGDTKLSFQLNPEPGWVIANDGSIGDAASNASNRANADTQALFELLYYIGGLSGYPEAYIPLQTSAGAATTRAAQGTATTAFNNHVRLVLPRTMGRALGVAGTGGGLSGRWPGGWDGAETFTQTPDQMPSHAHSVYDPSHAHTQWAPVYDLAVNAGNQQVVPSHIAQNQTTTAANASIGIYANGGSAAMNIMPPRVYLSLMIKL